MQTTRVPTEVRSRRWPALVVGLIGVWLLAACGSEDQAAPAAPEAQHGSSGPSIEIRNFAFAPPTLQVPPGAKITVTNTDSAVHTATADDGSFDSGNVDAGGKREITAPSAGEIRYKCTIHQYMTGVIRIGSS